MTTCPSRPTLPCAQLVPIDLMGLGGQGLVKFTCLLRLVPTDVALPSSRRSSRVDTVDHFHSDSRLSKHDQNRSEGQLWEMRYLFATSEGLKYI